MVDDGRVDEHEIRHEARRFGNESKDCSVKRSASSTGFAMVAEEQRKTGSSSDGRCGEDAVAQVAAER
jgi:hypothetical protein